jgi:myo-inositol 2-dehydrogenase/D-chiro-inositol 1-dehydrogenase
VEKIIMTIKLGVIGTGAIGKEHIRRCSQVLQGATVVAVSDINLDNARAVVNSLGLQAEIYADGYDVIKSKEVDALLVTSWDPTHEDYTLAAIAAGKPVFCEKPLALTAEGCRRVVDAEMKAGRRLVQVGFMRQYDQGYVALKKVIDQGEIGAPLMLHCAHRNLEVGDSYVTNMAITNTLIHELDVLRWLINDDYHSVQVRFPRSTSHTHARLKDPQIVMIETKKGMLIDVEIFVNCRYGYDIQCHVVGEEGIASLPEPSSVLMRKDAHLATNILTDWKDRFIDAYDIELQAFINDVQSGELRGPSAWDGFAASVAADACVKAQESGATEIIDLPARPAFYHR